MVLKGIEQNNWRLHYLHWDDSLGQRKEGMLSCISIDDYPWIDIGNNGEEVRWRGGSRRRNQFLP